MGYDPASATPRYARREDASANHQTAHADLARLTRAFCNRLLRPAGLNMISDSQLASFVNTLGVLIFVLIIVYHYLAVNQPAKRR